MVHENSCEYALMGGRCYCHKQYLTKESAIEAAAELALKGKLPTSNQLASMLRVGVDFKNVHNILSEVFYNGEELEDAESE